MAGVPRGAQNHSIPEQSPTISAFLHWSHFFFFFIPLKFRTFVGTASCCFAGLRFCQVNLKNFFFWLPSWRNFPLSQQLRSQITMLSSYPASPRQACERRHPNWLREAKDIWFLECERKRKLEDCIALLPQLMVTWEWRSQIIDKKQVLRGLWQRLFGSRFAALHWYCYWRAAVQPHVQPVFILSTICSVCSRDTSRCMIRESFIV